MQPCIKQKHHNSNLNAVIDWWRWSVVANLIQNIAEKDNSKNNKEVNRVPLQYSHSIHLSISSRGILRSLNA